MRQLALAAFLAFFALPSNAAERWEILPPTPAPIATDRSGEAEANGIKIHYAIYGQGSPVIFLHGGLANTDYWGNQVPAVAAHHTVILMDSRGHGRSTRDARPYGYDLMADDVVALMDVLKIPKADVVGWSDGGILGVDLAMRHKERVGKVFAFAPTQSPLAWSRASRKIQRSPPILSAPAMNIPSTRRHPRNTTPSSIRSARCGRTSRTGRTISSRRSTRPFSSSTATMTRRSSGRIRNISRRPFRTLASSFCRT
jgi:pimeloyl-ACP methyl ester carboxylesterase